MMKRLFAGVLILAATAAMVSAQTLSSSAVVADVPFSFIVSGKPLPAGTYKFTPNNSLVQITVTNSKTNESAMSIVVTRLSPRSDGEASLVFDVAGDDHYLAEIYIPGMDGFQVPCAPGKHTHVVVKAKK